MFIGAKGRSVGAILLDIALVVLAGAAFYTTFQLGGGVTGLIKLLTLG